MKTKRTLAIPIRCGEKTCTTAPGYFCAFLRVSRYGIDYSCRLFSEQYSSGLWVALEEKDGLILRSADCLRAEKLGSKP